MLQHISQFPSFLRLNNESIAWIYCILLSHSPVDGYLACFYFLGIVNDSYEHGCSSILVPSFSSFGYMFRNRGAGTYVNSVLNFLRNFHTVLNRGCVILHSPAM